MAINALYHQILAVCKHKPCKPFRFRPSNSLGINVNLKRL